MYGRTGLIVDRRTGKSGGSRCELTPAGEDLRGVVISLGLWGHRWIESSVSLKKLDPSLLMWNMRRRIVPSAFPARRCTVKFTYSEARSGRKTWWVVIEDGTVDVCLIDPGHDIDLFVRGSLRSMTVVWMGLSTLEAEMDAGHISLEGDRGIARD